MTQMSHSQQLLILQTIHDAVNYLILNPEHQTAGTMARNALGESVHPTDPSACQWCALGRIMHDLDLPGKRLDELCDNYLYPLGITSRFIIRHNDAYNPDQRQIKLKMLSKAISEHPVLLAGRRAS